MAKRRRVRSGDMQVSAIICDEESAYEIVARSSVKLKTKGKAVPAVRLVDLSDDIEDDEPGGWVSISETVAKGLKLVRPATDLSQVVRDEP